MKEITLRPTQDPFVHSTMRYPFYIGGIGSGKTFSGNVRGLQWSQQKPAKGRLYGPRGCVLAATFPILLDVVLPEFFEIEADTGLLKKFVKSPHPQATLHSFGCTGKGRNCCPDSIILFKSLDRHDWARGLNLSWFFVDEGRHIGLDAFHVLVGRLRQPGFKHSGWVTSTPNGFDWMWQLAHVDSPFKLNNCFWYQASTYDNAVNLPEDFLEDLARVYKEGSPLWRQEVMGEFVGLMRGAVFQEFDPTKHVLPLSYDPNLPLYSAWDFGIGDLGVVLFLQLDEETEVLENGETRHLPTLRIVGYLEAANRNAGEWATEFFQWCDRNTNGRIPDANYGDPAGIQRGPTGVSWISELRAHGINIYPAPKKQRDYSIHILRTMMARNGILVSNSKDCSRLGQALASHRWDVDDRGNRIGQNPIHDWTSHGATALGYFVAGRPELTHMVRRSTAATQSLPQNSFQHILRQLERGNSGSRFLGPQDPGYEEWSHPPVTV